MCFHSETDSGTASDFQKGQYSQCFSDELRSCWCYSSPVHNHLSQTPLSYRTVLCLYPDSDWLSPCWQTDFEMHLFVPSMLGRSLGQGPCWLCAHATPCTLPVKSSGFCMQGRREDAAGPVAGAGGSCFLLLAPLWWLVLVGWGVVTWEGVGREWKEEKTYVLLPCLQTLVPENALLFLNFKNAGMV